VQDIEIDGALFGIAVVRSRFDWNVVSSEGIVAEIDTVCGGSVIDWAARHHATLMFLPAIFRGISQAMTRWGISAILYPMPTAGFFMGEGLVMQRAVPFALHAEAYGMLGTEHLRIFKGESPSDSSVSFNYHPTVGPTPRPARHALIAGSASRVNDISERVSRALGAALAERNIGIITGGWPGVDELVTDAYASAARRRGLRSLDRHVRHVLGKIEPRPDLPGQRIVYRNEDEAIIESVKEADAVIVIAGFGGTAWVAEEARKRGKPLMLIPPTGGISARLAGDFPPQPWWSLENVEDIAARIAEQLTDGPLDFSAHEEPIAEGVKFRKMMAPSEVPSDEPPPPHNPGTPKPSKKSRRK
jgi:hypothetical protein